MAESFTLVEVQIYRVKHYTVYLEAIAGLTKATYWCLCIKCSWYSCLRTPPLSVLVFKNYVSSMFQIHHSMCFKSHKIIAQVQATSRKIHLIYNIQILC